MNWLSKVVINEFEMPIKDATARAAVEQNTTDIALNNSKLNRIWGGETYETQFFVSTNGNDDNDGRSSANAFRTINKAIEMSKYYIANPTNAIVIFIAGGHYYENITFGSTNWGKKYVIMLTGDVHIHGCLKVNNCLCECFSYEGEHDLYMYQDDTYTPTTYNHKALLCIYLCGKFFTNRNIYCNTYSDDFLPALLAENSELYCATLYCVGQCENIIISTASKINCIVNKENAIISGADIRCSHTLLFKRGTDLINYTDFNNIVAGQGLSIYTP